MHNVTLMKICSINLIKPSEKREAMWWYASVITEPINMDHVQTWPLIVGLVLIAHAQPATPTCVSATLEMILTSLSWKSWEQSPTLKYRGTCV